MKNPVLLLVGLLLLNCINLQARVPNNEETLESSGLKTMFAITAESAVPILHFSDVISGPKTGNTDGLGEGAIITLWGNRLGSEQSGSKVFFKDTNGTAYEAAHVYYWKNADGQLPSGPADLFQYHGMQEIAFSIPSSAADGLGQLYVEVNGQASNQLDFTIRNGNIYFVKVGGDDNGGDGSWNNPWESLEHIGDNVLNQGDIVYATDGVIQTDAPRGFTVRGPSGTENEPISVIAYPNSEVIVTTQGTSHTIHNWNRNTAYWNFSKIKTFVDGKGSGISAFRGSRIIANEIYGVEADGAGGAITGSNLNNPPEKDVISGIKCFGNYIHDFGNDTSSKLHHVFYLSNRGGYMVEAYELAWNLLVDNKVRFGLHIYDENHCGGFSGVFKIHGNVVVNQSASGFHASAGHNLTGGVCFSTPIDVYNNIFINNGLAPFVQKDAILLRHEAITSHVRFFNNVIYGYGDEGTGSAVYVQDNGNPTWNYGGTYEFFNNIIVDTKNLPFTHPTYWKTPVGSGNNIWYDPEGTLSPPVWESSPITANPEFIDPENGNFKLNKDTNSPGIDAGSAIVSLVVWQDIQGNTRPQGAGFDIGAFEYAENGGGGQILSVLESENSMIEVFPNPVKDFLTIDMEGQSFKEYNVYNISGQKVQSDSSINKNQINVSNLQQGVYFLEFATDKGKTVLKFVKE